MTQTQNDVLSTIFKVGAVTDRNLIHATKTFEVHTTDSGIRTRRRELVERGLVEPVGKAVYPGGKRPVTVWDLTPKGIQVAVFGG